MLFSLSIFPFPFWLVIALLIGGALLAIAHLRDGCGFPMLAVLGTVAFWYVGDAIYNDYANNHAKIFAARTLASAWWQVGWFVAVFLAVTPPIHRWYNARHLQRSSGVLEMLHCGVGQPGFQRQLNLLFVGCVIIWLVLAAIAAIRLHEQVLYYFFPFLGYKAEAWGRSGRIGTGFDPLYTVAFYFQQLTTGVFGVVAALAANKQTKGWALFFCALSWPNFIFDRTRNSMLAAIMPGILSWGLLGVRGSIIKKASLLVMCFLLVNAWMKFVIANRSSMSITTAFKEQGFSLKSKVKVKHEGLNMYEELCWISLFIEQGTYRPNWGTRYFAELVNPVPRALWRNKPLIGIDYSIARGGGGGEARQADVSTTFSTGLIGQGVVNFGRVLGPVAAAWLMGIWVAVMARLDLHIQELGRLPLYGLAMILTFNLGRDITFITLYPFVFGCLVIWWWEHRRPYLSQRAKMQRQPANIVGGLRTMNNERSGRCATRSANTGSVYIRR